jgi:Rrf2 family protein
VIRVSKQTDYGLRAIRHLALVPPGEFRSARQIATRYGLPPALVAKLLQRLARKGLVASQHGTKGGYQIARPASEITLRAVIEAIEGPPAPADCRHETGESCPGPEGCASRRPVATVHRKIAEVLERTTLGDL